MKQKLNLTLEESLVKQMKLRAVLEKRSVSEIIEELCREYLKRGKPKKQ